MRYSLQTLLIVLILLPAFAAAQDGEEKLNELQGRWVVQSWESKNRKQDGNGTLVRIVGDKMSMESPKSGGMAQITAVDLTADPKCIDLTSKISGQVSTGQAIFKIEGDILTICSRLPGHGRPSRFDVEEPGNHLAIYKRKPQ